MPIILGRKGGGTGGGGAPSGPAGGDLSGTYPNPDIANGVIAEAMLAATFAEWDNWTPVLTADTTNPTLGTGSIQAGRFIQLGKLLVISGHVQFGTSGTAAGSGVYRINLPVGITNDHDNMTFGGVAYLRDNDTSTRRVAAIDLSGTNDNFAMFGDALTAFVSNTSPWTWTVSDFIKFLIVAQAA